MRRARCASMHEEKEAGRIHAGIHPTFSFLPTHSPPSPVPFSLPTARHTSNGPDAMYPLSPCTTTTTTLVGLAPTIAAAMLRARTQGQTPYHIARDMHAPVDLVELLHTSTDMMAMFTQDLLMQGAHAPPRIACRFLASWGEEGAVHAGTRRGAEERAHMRVCGCVWTAVRGRMWVRALSCARARCMRTGGVRGRCMPACRTGGAWHGMQHHLQACMDACMHSLLAYTPAPPRLRVRAHFLRICASYPHARALAPPQPAPAIQADRGVPKLSFIAAAALKSKLNEDIRFVRRSSPAGAAGAGGSRSAGGAGSPSKPPSSGPVYARRGRLDSAPQVERMSRGGSVASVDDDAASIHDVRVGPQASPSGGSGIGSRGTPYVRTRFASTGAGGVPLDDSGEDAGGDAAAVEAEVVELVGGGNDGGPGGEEADPLLGSGAPCFHTKHNAHEPPSSLGAGSDVGTSDSGRCSSGDGGASPSAAVASALTACDSVDEETACMLCFEGRADVQIGGCHHKMCANCANELTARVMCQPLSCPFCRASITAFVPAPKEEGAGVV